MRRNFLAALACAMLAACGGTEPGAPDRPAAAAMPANGARADRSLTVTAPDGVTIHYDDEGRGEVTLLFVHGWSCDRSYWNAQRDYFAPRHRVVTVDLAGHGESAENRDQFTMEAFGADVAAVARALDLRNIVLVGHSMGGSVVLAAANQLPGRVLAVVAVDTLRDVAARPSREQLEQSMARSDEEFAADIRGFVDGMFVAQSDPKLIEWVMKDMTAAPLRVARSAGFGLGMFDAQQAIKTLAAPLILINSDYLPTRLAPIEAVTDRVSYIEMTGVGHFVMMEDPATFNRHLENVVRSLSPEVNASAQSVAGPSPVQKTAAADRG